MVVMLLTTSIGLSITHSNQFIRDKINDSLVDSHFKVIPSVGTFTARGLTGGDTEDLGGHTDGTSNLDLLIDGNTLDISAGYVLINNKTKGTLFDGLDVGGDESNTNTMNFFLGNLILFH